MICLLKTNIFRFTRCLVLHPVSYPNKGPLTEQYLAEEAIGLASSLGWEVCRGPFWKNEITATKIQTKDNLLYIESDPNELRDGQYVKTSIGNGVIYVYDI
eukprot:GHVR01150397.1.p1 GENE.GHVR01150397.1~~GHVR01150397.1.p1  ORF type:complete len:101 (-),score=9.17 GHVR01150397.1:2474-2776(-)